MASAESQLYRVLERSRELGFLGPGDIDAQVEHALAFLPALASRERILDLGSGGGLPGLVLATHLTDAEFVLLDAQGRRCTFLESAVE
ncbi:MAG: RsmG family class I SAM-dependent methyltransferase, partial [Microthrixaceae bacterium]